MPDIDTSIPAGAPPEEFDFRIEFADDLYANPIVWTEFPGVKIRGEVDETAGSAGHAQAVLTYEFGFEALDRDNAPYQQRNKLSLKGKIVRISIGPDEAFDDPPTATMVRRLYYYVVDQSETKAPVETREVDEQQEFVETYGQQVFECFGLSWFLDGPLLEKSITWFTSADWKSLSPHVPPAINRPLVFNGGSSSQFDADWANRGNRAVNDSPLDHNSEQWPVFEDPSTTADGGVQLWTDNKIVEYLLHWFPPTIEDTASPPDRLQHPLPWTFDNSVGTFLSARASMLDPAKMTLFDVLNELASPTRGLVWFIDPSLIEDPLPENRALLIVVQSANQSPVVVNGSTRLAANTDQSNWNFENDLHVGTPAIDRPNREKYRTVRVRGARRTTIATVSSESGTIEPDWDDGDAPAEGGSYRDGGGGTSPTSGYAALETEEKEKRNDAIRQSDRFDNVYTTFKIIGTFDGRTSDGSSTTATAPCCPVINVSGVALDESVPFHTPGLRLLNTLPMLVGYDYSVDPAAPAQNTPNRRANFRKPFAVVPLNSAKDRWQYADKLTDVKFEGSEFESLTPYSFDTGDQYPCFELRPDNGLNHTLAKNHFVEGANAEPSAVEPEIDWQDVRVTCCLEFDEFAEYVYPDNIVPDPFDELLIEAGSRYRMDYLAANTILDVDKNGQLTLAAAAGFIRDDRQALADIAATAYSHYQADRAQMRIQIDYIYDNSQFRLGQMIAGIGDPLNQLSFESINSVITRLAFSVQPGGDDNPRGQYMKIVTGRPLTNIEGLL